MTYDSCADHWQRAAGAVALLLLSPVMAVVAICVARDLGRPVLFRQARTGLHGRLFVMYKFRTMSEPTSEALRLATDADRVTALGSWLRATSLDELPGLYNVVRGDMNLVGPRPLLPEYLERYDEVQRRRHDVRPGLTGLAQVQGRNDGSWERRLAVDVRYVSDRSLALDLRIIVATARQVLRRRAVEENRRFRMSEFLGSGATGDPETPVPSERIAITPVAP